jgi:hypothetical protein
LACANSLALITERTVEGEVLESPKDKPQSFANPRKNRSGVEEKASNLDFRGEVEGEFVPAFTAARLIAFWRMGTFSDPLPLSLERVPAIGETTEAERLALAT